MGTAQLHARSTLPLGEAVLLPVASSYAHTALRRISVSLTGGEPGLQSPFACSGLACLTLEACVLETCRAVSPRLAAAPGMGCDQHSNLSEWDKEVVSFSPYIETLWNEVFTIQTLHNLRALPAQAKGTMLMLIWLHTTPRTNIDPAFRWSLAGAVCSLCTVILPANFACEVSRFAPQNTCKLEQCTEDAAERPAAAA